MDVYNSWVMFSSFRVRLHSQMEMVYQAPREGHQHQQHVVTSCSEDRGSAALQAVSQRPGSAV